MLNDVSSSLAAVAAEHGAGFVAMHRKGTPADMQRDPRYDDVVGEVGAFLERCVAGGPGRRRRRRSTSILESASASRCATISSSWPRSPSSSRPGSRCWWGRAARASSAISAPAVPPTAGSGTFRLSGAGERLEGSLASAVWAMACGAAVVRVHDVAATVQAARLFGEVAA